MKLTNFTRRSFTGLLSTAAVIGVLGATAAMADTLGNIMERGTVVIGIQGDNRLLVFWTQPDRTMVMTQHLRTFSPTTSALSLS